MQSGLKVEEKVSEMLNDLKVEEKVSANAK